MDQNNKCNGAINSSGTSKVTTTTRAPANGIVDTKSVLQCRHGIVQQWLGPLVVYGIALINCGHCVWLSALIRILHAKSEMNPTDFGLESSSGFWGDIELWSFFCVNECLECLNSMRILFCLRLRNAQVCDRCDGTCNSDVLGDDLRSGNEWYRFQSDRITCSEVISSVFPFE